ncbi:hypothetical protein ACWF62_14190 [Rhodococcus sp. NPDC054953]
MLSTYDDAARALNAVLPSQIVRAESAPGFFTLFGPDWHVVVFCRWWLAFPDGFIVDGDSLDAKSAATVVDSMLGRTVDRFAYAADRPEVAQIAFEDGEVLGIETDSDYEPWSLHTPLGSFTAALSDFRGGMAEMTLPVRGLE